MHSRAGAGLLKPLFGTGRAAKSRMAEPCNIFTDGQNRFTCNGPNC